MNIPAKKHFFPLAALVASMHFFGFFLMNWEVTRHFFEALTPVNLLVSLFALLYFHPQWSPKVIVACVLVGLGGFGVEVVGVQTGLIFGQYSYGANLGIKLWDVPLMIGINWLMLVYATASLVAASPLPLALKALVPAVLMTALDYLIEPVAIAHGYWDWYGLAVPLQNYLGWFVSAYVLAFLFFGLGAAARSRMAWVVLLSQLFFFAMHLFIG